MQPQSLNGEKLATNLPPIHFPAFRSVKVKWSKGGEANRPCVVKPLDNWHLAGNNVPPALRRWPFRTGPKGHFFGHLSPAMSRPND